jgi:hypothetical protein
LLLKSSRLHCGYKKYTESRERARVMTMTVVVRFMKRGVLGKG